MLESSGCRTYYYSVATTIPIKNLYVSHKFTIVVKFINYKIVFLDRFNYNSQRHLVIHQRSYEWDRRHIQLFNNVWIGNIKKKYTFLVLAIFTVF